MTLKIVFLRGRRRNLPAQPMRPLLEQFTQAADENFASTSAPAATVLVAAAALTSVAALGAVAVAGACFGRQRNGHNVSRHDAAPNSASPIYTAGNTEGGGYLPPPPVGAHQPEPNGSHAVPASPAGMPNIDSGHAPGTSNGLQSEGSTVCTSRLCAA